MNSAFGVEHGEVSKSMSYGSAKGFSTGWVKAGDKVVNHVNRKAYRAGRTGAKLKPILPSSKKAYQAGRARTQNGL